MKKSELKIGVVGATGVVGQTFINLLDERKVRPAELRLFASDASAGKKITLHGETWELRTLAPDCFKGLDLVFFSSGDDISKEWAPQAVKAGAFAVDNSGAFRMDPSIPLIVPEVNGHLLKKGMAPVLIANPNCSTIQLVVALKPLQEKFGLQEVRVSSYQSVSGAGQAGVDELLGQIKDFQNSAPLAKVFPHPILHNAIPQIGSFNDDGFCTEEVKIMKETRKIMGLPSLKISAFTVRVPALNSHSETVWITLSKKATRTEVLSALNSGEGLEIHENHADYPTARKVSGTDPVSVGRVHGDPEDPTLWMMWIVSDNVRKGAALNGWQIAERIFDI